jgi:hypothetical protein
MWKKFRIKTPAGVVFPVKDECWSCRAVRIACESASGACCGRPPDRNVLERDQIRRV